ncbi:HD domain-containing protein [Agrilactobacillus fermenti]|uniref:HD domain-containing protein n=1 Tax=Agrilactobacillus fermenti TaxID=2586909 RepID=UPI001E3DEA47|nr:HD domain-containing protein [Agrilactobacillus fermenti]MCD2256707.1 HD domain-containing protein [Agrilactobacillus fermenti]
MANATRLMQIQQYTQQQLQQATPDHDFAHAQRVAKMAVQIQQHDFVQLDPELLQTTAYVHDLIDDKVVTDPLKAQQKLQQQLQKLHFSPPQINEIFDIITHLSFSKNLQQHYHLSPIGKVVQDADRLDALGAIGIARAFYYGGKRNEPLYNPDIKPRQLKNKAEYRQTGTVINHFYEKLFQLPEQMNTVYAQKLAQERVNLMHQFVDQFKADWSL